MCGPAAGQGVAEAVLARIEEEVRSAGLPLLRLETGNRQVAAMRLYMRTGFRECPAFGDRAESAASHCGECILRETDGV